MKELSWNVDNVKNCIHLKEDLMITSKLFMRRKNMNAHIVEKNKQQKAALIPISEVFT